MRKNKAKKSAKLKGMADPTKISRIDAQGQLRVVIETPQGSRNKFAFDPDEEIFVLKKVLPAGMTFPYDFGFVPQTRADDGDPIDVLVLMDEAAFPGCTVQARIIGVLGAQEEENGKRERNDRLIAVSIASPCYSEMKSVDELGKRLLKDIEQFFTTYQRLQGKKFKLLRIGDGKQAMKLIEKASIVPRKPQKNAA